MKAIRVHAFGPAQQLIYEDVAEPQPGPDEVIVTVTAAGVNPADWKFRSGLLAAAVKSLPFVPGMDIAGRVTAVGNDVTDWKVGDRAMAMLHLMGNGAYQERVAVPAAWCAPIPPALDDVTAASLPTPAITAIEWIEDDLRITTGDRILITGAVGAVGSIACYVAKLRGAYVTAAVRTAQRENVRHADDVLLLDSSAAIESESFDCIADTIGGKTAERLLPTLKRGRVLSTISTDPAGNPESLDVVIRFFGNYPDARRLATLAAAVARSELNIRRPLTLRLSEAPRAHELIERGGAGKIVLVPDALI
jgi:NADPH2:quinone reductase